MKNNKCKSEVQYMPPANMKRKDGLSRFAYVTFLMMNESYLASALMLAYSLKCMQTKADVICMVTEEISESAITALELIFDYVVKVEKIFVAHKNRQDRQDRVFWFTRLNALRMGADGDLGFKYEKVTILDADVYALRYFDHLFTLSAPAGIINENKKNCVEYDNNDKIYVSDLVRKQGKWNWHKRYEPECAHGKIIPKYITDRIISDPLNMGINGSMFVFDTSFSELEKIKQEVLKPEIKKYVSDLFKWPDMHYFTMRWSGNWTSIDIRFSSFNGYPDIASIYGIHYSGFKPWYFTKKGYSIHTGFEDFRFWYQKFKTMTEQDYPGLLRNKKISKVYKEIVKYIAG